MELSIGWGCGEGQIGNSINSDKLALLSRELGDRRVDVIVGGSEGKMNICRLKSEEMWFRRYINPRFKSHESLKAG